MLARPTDRGARADFEDSGYTLCVLMGKRCAREAAEAAERYLRSGPVTYLREQEGEFSASRPVHRAPPATLVRTPAGR